MEEKDFDFEHLTKEQALYLHRKLWNTLADKILEWKRPVEKWEIFDLYGWPEAQADCWCCEYGEQIKPACRHCPIKWVNGEFNNCRCFDSPYKKWEWQMTINRGRKPFEYLCLDELAGYAREIANLPERKE